MKDLALPDLLQDIADAAGVEAALAVARAKGGVRAYFSIDPTADDWLVALLGRKQAVVIGQALVGGKQGENLLVPMGPTRTDRDRWRRIMRLSEAGHSQEAIARMVGCHYKTVQRILSGKRKTVASALAQHDMFER